MAGREDDHGDHFERVLLLWAAGAQDNEAPSRERLIAAVSAKLHAAWLWKLAFGFPPLIGPVMDLMVDGSMTARIYRLFHRFYLQPSPRSSIASPPREPSSASAPYSHSANV